MELVRRCDTGTGFLDSTASTSATTHVGSGVTVSDDCRTQNPRYRSGDIGLDLLVFMRLARQDIKAVLRVDELSINEET